MQIQNDKNDNDKIQETIILFHVCVCVCLSAGTHTTELYAIWKP